MFILKIQPIVNRKQIYLQNVECDFAVTPNFYLLFLLHKKRR